MRVVRPGCSGSLRVNLAICTRFASPSFLEQPDSVVIGVKLIPGETVARRNRVRMMIVVPSLTAGQKRHPPAVPRFIASFKSATTVHVCCRIHEPCRVQAQSDAKEDAPQKQADPIRNSADQRSQRPVGRYPV